MLAREPVAAGRFYPEQRDELAREVSCYLAEGEKSALARAALPTNVWGVMLPHAGHIFCGNVIGATLAGLKLPSRLIILCPNHTGHGSPLGVWPKGAWATPLGAIPVDKGLAAQLLAAGGLFETDVTSHIGEHAIEVILPFLQAKIDNLAIVPVCVGTRMPAVLKAAGHALAQVLKANPDVGLVVSSDMNHYESHEDTLNKDEQALAKACASDPDGLMDVTERENISMCGAAPLAIALYAGKELGRTAVALAAHDTSGPVSGDYEHTVGYAGLRLCVQGSF